MGGTISSFEFGVDAINVHQMCTECGQVFKNRAGGGYPSVSLSRPFISYAVQTLP